MLKFNTPPSKQQLHVVKGMIFALCLLPLLRLILLAALDDLSANPIEFIEHSTGFWALVLLLITLSITPLRALGVLDNWTIAVRRMLGLFMFFYACLHVATYLWLDFDFVWEDIFVDVGDHPRILVGFLAFVLAIPLAVTSNNMSVRRLGTRWKKLHRLVYILAVLAVVHFLWLVKQDLREPLLYALILAVLLGWRIHNYFSKAIQKS